jgi:hypothetical protein
MEPHPKENDQEAVEDSDPKSSPSIGEKLKELLTAKPTSSEDEEPQRVEKEQMSAPQEEFIQEPQPSKNKEK